MCLLNIILEGWMKFSVQIFLLLLQAKIKQVINPSSKNSFSFPTHLGCIVLLSNLSERIWRPCLFSYKWKIFRRGISVYSGRFSKKRVSEKLRRLSLATDRYPTHCAFVNFEQQASSCWHTFSISSAHVAIKIINNNGFALSYIGIK